MSKSNAYRVSEKESPLLPPPPLVLLVVSPPLLPQVLLLQVPLFAPHAVHAQRVASLVLLRVGDGGVFRPLMVHPPLLVRCRTRW